MDILRFFTAGNVDDGKSTLIGRMLFDSGSIAEDQMEALLKASKNKEEGEVDLALLTDGLRAEREQGITIDVAYKYFDTPRRKFIIADTPGHVQYTRNMVTGASHCQLAIILVDARNGVTEQTKRHTFICHLLGIKHLIIAINKMDLVEYSQSVYENIQQDFQQFAKPLAIPNLTFIPLSALKGDNVVKPSIQMDWYVGLPLLSYLEEVNIPLSSFPEARFQVQYIIRPQTEDLHDYRGYAGKVLSGTYKSGDAITVLPAGLQSRIKSVEFNQNAIEEAYSPMSVILHLEDDIDISRGDMIVHSHQMPTLTNGFLATICWFDAQALNLSKKYLLQQNSRTVKCALKAIKSKVNIHTLASTEGGNQMVLNEIGTVAIKTAEALSIDLYENNPETGSFILIDEQTNNTVAAGMVSMVDDI
ncbi:MAG: GTP-binding protein [Cytophagales bacterium]|nr:MAG: GTP-binding protein [Cytophagales bacterium]